MSFYVACVAVAAAFVLCGIRFRKWAVEGRLGVPRFSRHAETVVLWLVYSGAVGFVVFWIRQALRHLG